MRTRRGRIDDDGRTDCRLCGWRVATDADGRCPLGHRVGVVTVLAAPEPAPVAEPVLVGAAVGADATSELPPFRSQPAWESAEAAAALDDLGEAPTAPLPSFDAEASVEVVEVVAEPLADDDPFAMFDDLGGWVPAPFASAGDDAAMAEAPASIDEPTTFEAFAPVDEPTAAELPAGLDEVPTPTALGATAPLPRPEQVAALRTAAALAGVDVRDPLAAFVLSDADPQPASSLDVRALPAPPAPTPAPADVGPPFVAEDEPARLSRWIAWGAGGLGLLAGAGLVVAAVVVAPL